MKRKNLMLTVAAAAVLGVFNPAFAGGDSSYEKDSSASAGANADITAGANVSPGAESSSASPSPDTTGATTGDSTAAADLERDRVLESDRDSDKLTGLDRADEVAGDHGQQGRDNAREKQQDMN
jgi:hypothetical protein